MDLVSACSGGQCVKVGYDNVRNVFLVFDEHGGSCEFDPIEWVEFVNGVKEGLFDPEKF